MSRSYITIGNDVYLATQDQIRYIAEKANAKVMIRSERIGSRYRAGYLHAGFHSYSGNASDKYKSIRIIREELSKLEKV